jgi:predicted metal-dependent HD superfamily phosphohydrolase
MDSQFALLWLDLQAKGSPDEAFHALATEYSRPPRSYHTLEHVRWGLKRIDEIVRHEELEERIDVLAVRWAMWFHDVSMSFGDDSAEDEERSGRMAHAAARAAGLPRAFRDTVLRLVLSTSRLAENLKPDEAVLVDADLSMLGASESDFDVYEARVRREWAEFDDGAFAAGRIAVLGSFLKKRRIFTTDFGRDKWEARAQNNLRRSVDRLKALL